MTLLTQKEVEARLKRAEIERIMYKHKVDPFALATVVWQLERRIKNLQEELYYATFREDMGK